MVDVISTSEPLGTNGPNALEIAVTRNAPGPGLAQNKNSKLRFAIFQIPIYFNANERLVISIFNDNFINFYLFSNFGHQ